MHRQEYGKFCNDALREQLEWMRRMQSLSGIASPVALNMNHTYFRIRDNFWHVRCTVTRFTTMNFITVQIGRSLYVRTSLQICNRQRRKLGRFILKFIRHLSPRIRWLYDVDSTSNRYLLTQTNLLLTRHFSRFIKENRLRVSID